MNKQKLASITLGSIVAAAALAPLAQAADNPFAAQSLQSGYQLAQADKKADGKCGEAKCGANKKAEKKAEAKMDAKADAKTDKKADGSCGGNKKPEGNCGAKK